MGLPAQYPLDTTIAIGANHTCARTIGNGAARHGNNDFGQLSDGTATDRHSPVGVPGLKDKVLLLAAGGYTAFAVTADGRMTCWGNTLYGQLGNGAIANSYVPADVAGMES